MKHKNMGELRNMSRKVSKITYIRMHALFY